MYMTDELLLSAGARTWEIDAQFAAYFSAKYKLQIVGRNYSKLDQFPTTKLY